MMMIIISNVHMTLNLAQSGLKHFKYIDSFIPHNSPVGRSYCYPHVVDEETEAQTG